MKIALITSFPPSRHALNEYGYHVAQQLRQERCVELTVLGDYLSTPAEELPGFNVTRCWAVTGAPTATSVPVGGVDSPHLNGVLVTVAQLVSALGSVENYPLTSY